MNKGGELLGQPCCRGGLQHLQQTCGKGSGEGKGLAASTALTGKKEVRSNDKALFGVGEVQLLELGEKATGMVFKALQQWPNSACCVQTLHL